MKYCVNSVLGKRFLTEIYYKDIRLTITTSKRDRRTFILSLFTNFVQIVLGIISIIFYSKKLISLNLFIYCMLLTFVYVLLEVSTLRWRFVRKQIGRYKEDFGVSVAHRTGKFFEDHFTWKNEENGQEQIIPYTSIRHIYETKNYYALHVNENIYGVEKASFCKGSADDFYTFIQRKINEHKEK